MMCEKYICTRSSHHFPRCETSYFLTRSILGRSIYIERDDSRHGQEIRKEIPSRVYTVGFTRVLNRKFI